MCDFPLLCFTTFVVGYPSIPSLVFLNPLSFSTDLATSLFSIYFAKRANFVDTTV